jgi:hypothetical protein
VQQIAPETKGKGNPLVGERERFNQLQSFCSLLSAPRLFGAAVFAHSFSLFLSLCLSLSHSSLSLSRSLSLSLSLSLSVADARKVRGRPQEAQQEEITRRR